MWGRVQNWWNQQRPDDATIQAQRVSLAQKSPPPFLWLFGKTGAGKSSIVRQLTGSLQAEIGNGYQPQTKTSSIYSFPNEDDPLIRFLDTRGLGEAGYDPSADLALFNQQAHLILVVVRATDHALEHLLPPLIQARKQRPQRPVLLALTSLHEAYPGEQHPNPDPFRSGLLIPPEISPALAKSLVHQQTRFNGLVDAIVPIDFTPPEDGFQNPNLGLDRLTEALVELLPLAQRESIRSMSSELKGLQSDIERQALPIILRASTLAATASATPWPLVEIPVVMGLQWHMVARIAKLYQQEWRSELVWQLALALSGRIAARLALKAPLKLIPIAGSAANSALSFAYTLSLGKACCWYFAEVKQGHVPTQEEFAEVWTTRLQTALKSRRS